MREQRSQQAAPKQPKGGHDLGKFLSDHWRRNTHHAEPEQSAKTLPRSSPSVARRRGNRLLPVSRQSPTTHSKSASATVMSRAQKSLHLWRWMRNVCGMELTAVSCHQRRSWHAGRNHTVSHFKRRNGLLRVAAAVAASLQHLHTRMNGSGAERAERGKNEEKKILIVKMVCFFLTQVTDNYSLPIKFSKKKMSHLPASTDLRCHDRPPLPQERKKRKKGKKGRKDLKSQQRSHHSGHTHDSSHDGNGASTSSIVITTSTSLLLFIEAILLLLFSVWSVTFVVLSSCGDFLCSGDWEGVAEG